MISQFFISRPKFAFVISIAICLAGYLALTTLPVNLYPQVTPPQIQVTAVYPGANALTVEEAVIRPLEEEINGVEGMSFIESTATNGSASITITFESGYDSDIAQVNVQNRVSIAQAKLPREVISQGVKVNKQSSSILMGINLIAEDGRFDQLFLSNYAGNNISEHLARIPGVSSITIFGEMDYSMRIWLDPKQMSSLEVTVGDVRAALQEQNVIVAAGKLGSAPSLPDQQFEYSIQTKGRLVDVKEFSNTIIRATESGAAIRLSDIARLEMGAQSYAAQSRLDGRDTVFIVPYQLAGANATEVAEKVRNRMAELSEQFPDGLSYKIIYDTTLFINRSIDSVVQTLWQAIILVILVVFLFLQNIRMTLIPAITIPVSLVGTFAVMSLLGYSINTITLFGIVLAIGVVVDDAIVVIENVERLITKEGMEPVPATREAMKQVTGAIIATTLVLLAVFIPISFMPGITGEIYKQFSITISSAVVISSINALTLSPALCAVLLKRKAMGHMAFLNRIENAIEKMTAFYTRWVSWSLKNTLIVVALFLSALIATAFLANHTPTGFIPDEDQGYLFVDIQLPDAASLNRTSIVMDEVKEIILADPAVENFIGIGGFSILGGASSSSGLGIIVFKDWDERTDGSLSQFNTMQRVQGKLWALQNASVMAFPLPAIMGMGNSAGFDFRLQDSQSRPPEELALALNGLIFAANQDPALSRVFSTSRANTPQYELDIDRDKAKALGVALEDIFTTLQAQLGSLYINDFNKFGRTYQVVIQAEAEFRSEPSDIQNFYVRNTSGQMVPLSTLAQMKPIIGPTSITRFNMFRSASVNGQTQAGYSSGDSIKAMERLAEKLPDGFIYKWAGQTAQEKEAGNAAIFIFVIAVIFVYLFLVALYESWTIPTAVLGAVPVAILGAFIGINLTPGIENNLYAQVGLILLIALSTKTAILIIEFAMTERKNGRSVMEAALNAARLRYRAVIMTALSFILGVLPLIFSSGPGAVSRLSIGITVFAGMVFATLFVPYLAPVFYQIIQAFRERIKAASGN